MDFNDSWLYGTVCEYSTQSKAESYDMNTSVVNETYVYIQEPFSTFECGAPGHINLFSETTK